MREAGAADLGALLAAAHQAVPRDVSSVRLYLWGSTSHLAEGWRDRVPRLELAAEDGAPEVIEASVRDTASSLGLTMVWESPAEVIPLPSLWQERCRPVSATQRLISQRLTSQRPIFERLSLFHFDPYSVVLRLVARGDEPDYLVALEYVRCGWVDPGRLEELHAEVVPRFSFRSLAQDPAEFRRKFSGLIQLVARSLASGGAAEPAAVDAGVPRP